MKKIMIFLLFNLALSLCGCSVQTTKTPNDIDMVKENNLINSIDNNESPNTVAENNSSIENEENHDMPTANNNIQDIQEDINNENSDGNEIVFQEDVYFVDELAGLTVPKAESLGYKIIGTSYNEFIPGKFDVLLDANIEKQEFKVLADLFEGMTITEFKELYQPILSYFENDNEYILQAVVGDLCIVFELEHGEEAMQLCLNNEADLNEMDLIDGDRMQNVRVLYLTISAELDESSANKILSTKDPGLETTMTMLEDLKIEKATYSLF